MSVTAQANRYAYSGDGSTTVFSYPALFEANSDLVVIYQDKTTKAETVKTLTTHYTVSGAGVSAGGSVTMLAAPDSNTNVIIYANPPIQQDFALTTNGKIPEASAILAWDKIVLLCRRLSGRLDRAIRLSEGSTDTFDPTFPKDYKDNPGATLRINDTGDGLDFGPTATAVSSAQTYANNAATSATAAANSATNAATSATNAAASASSASTSATNAANSATAAAASAASAAAAAAAAVGTPWQEFLTGTFSGGNTTFTMSHAPLAAAELLAILGSTPQEQTVDYTLSSVTVTFTGIDVSAQKLFVKGRY